MPVMNGDIAAKLIKQQPKLKSIPIIALTALAMREQEEQYTGLFDYYLKKPIAMNELVQCLIQFLPYTENRTNRKFSRKISKLHRRINSRFKKLVSCPINLLTKTDELIFMPSKINQILQLQFLITELEQNRKS